MTCVRATDYAMTTDLKKKKKENITKYMKQSKFLMDTQGHNASFLYLPPQSLETMN